MLGSLVTGARATIRRVGARDHRLACEASREGPDRSECAGKKRSEEELPEEELGSSGTYSLSSVSSSFSRLDLSSSASSVVTRAVDPLKRALAGDSETVTARASLTRYRAELSAALREAASAAATRKEERRLLLKALEEQERDLRCWGYLSILPTFREHRRRETIRSEIQIQLAEDMARVLALRHEEVTCLLKSTSVVEIWSQAVTGMVKNVPGRGSRSMTEDGQDELQAAAGKRSDLVLQVQAIIVPPSQLLATNQGLKITRRKLRACDQACAAAADAFARLVVDAGGLEPRSHEERSHILLALLTRYDVVTKSISGGVELLPSEGLPRDRGTDSGVDAHGLASRHSGIPTDNCESLGEEVTKGDVEIAGHEALGLVKEVSPSQGGHCPEVNDSGSDGSTITSASSPVTGSAYSATAIVSRVEDPAGHTDIDGVTHQAKVGASPSPNQGIVGAAASKNVPSMSRSRETSTCPPMTNDPCLGASRVQRDYLLELPEGCANDVKSSGAIDGEALESSRPRGSARIERDAEAEEKELLADARKACEDAFLELLSDERTREGRLLRRFLMMASAKRGTDSSVPEGDRSTGESSRGPGGSAARAERKTGLIPRGARGARATNSEDEAAIGPKGVKAFINYFSREYLKGRFDVPDVLVPALTELVASLVFRQARPLLLGYDRGRVAENDLVWRDKAAKVRLLSLLQLGVSPEYIPTGAEGYGFLQTPTEPCTKLETRIALDLGGHEHLDQQFDGNVDAAENAVTLAEAVAIVGGGRGKGFVEEGKEVTLRAEMGPRGDAGNNSDANSESEARVERLPEAIHTACDAYPGVSPFEKGRDRAMVVNQQVSPTKEVGASQGCGASVQKKGSSDAADRRSGACPAQLGETGTPDLSGVQKDRCPKDGHANECARKPLAEGDEEASKNAPTSPLRALSKQGIGVAAPSYAGAFREFGRLGECVTPGDLLRVVKKGMCCLAEDAAKISAVDKPLDADTLLPLLVYALVRANVPRIHESLNFIRNFRRPSWGGEEAYYVTSIEAAVSFVMDWSPDDASMKRAAASESLSPYPTQPADVKNDDAFTQPSNVADEVRHLDPDSKVPEDVAGRKTRVGDGLCRRDDESAGERRGRGEENLDRDDEEGREELMRLGIFLESHKEQENTVDVLSSMGWL